MRRDRRTSLLVVALAAWLGALPSLAILHRLNSPHWYCPLHGRFEEIARRDRSGRAADPGEPSAGPPGGIPIADPGCTGLDRDGSDIRTHLRCDISNDYCGASSIPPARPSLAGFLLGGAAPPPSARNQGSTSIAVLHFAPKHSPPCPLL